MQIRTITCGQSNVYLLYHDNTGILIDTGTDKYKEKIVECCRYVKIRLIVLTHGHFDHCQNAAYLARQLNCFVGIAKEDEALLANHQKRKVFGKGLWSRFYAWVSNCSIRTRKIEAVTPDVIMEEGMSLEAYGIDGEIVRLAGHTEGSVGVRLASGELFVGDAMQNILFPAAAWCYEDEAQAMNSVKKIRDMDVAKLFFGHGKSMERKRDKRKGMNGMMNGGNSCTKF